MVATANVSEQGALIKSVVEFGKYSFELEQKREESLLGQASRMMTATSLFGIISMVIMHFFDNGRCIKLCKVPFIFAMLSLVASVFMALMTTWRYEYKNLMDAERFYDHLYKNYDVYRKQADSDELLIKQISDIHRRKKVSNDRRLKWVRWSIRLFIFAIVVVSILMVAIMFV